MAADGALLGGASPPEPSVLNGRSSLFGLPGGASPPEPSVLRGGLPPDSDPVEFPHYPVADLTANIEIVISEVSHIH